MNNTEKPQITTEQVAQVIEKARGWVAHTRSDNKAHVMVPVDAMETLIEEIARLHGNPEMQPNTKALLDFSLSRTKKKPRTLTAEQMHKAWADNTLETQCPHCGLMPPVIGSRMYETPTGHYQVVFFCIHPDCRQILGVQIVDRRLVTGGNVQLPV